VVDGKSVVVVVVVLFLAVAALVVLAVAALVVLVATISLTNCHQPSGIRWLSFGDKLGEVT
jgi:hypothetical protein